MPANIRNLMSLDNALKTLGTLLLALVLWNSKRIVAGQDNLYEEVNKLKVVIQQVSYMQENLQEIKAVVNKLDDRVRDLEFN